MRHDGFQQDKLSHMGRHFGRSKHFAHLQMGKSKLTSLTTPLIVIPARMAASRLPGKPLADIEGKPMLVRVIARARAAGLGQVAVAAGDDELLGPSRDAGALAVLTDKDLPSGSDRVFAALQELDPDGRYDPIINLQGDMPTIDPELLTQALAVYHAHEGADLATLVSPSTDHEARQDPNVVKAIVSRTDAAAQSGRCLYFTRADAPWGEGPVMRHVGLYVWRRSALARFVAAPPSPLEQREKLEQLRALDLGMTIVAGLVDDFPKGVDTLEHLESARAWYREQGL
jgi:3-deoxy-manno-octulosonate cytidylyltransferase (CMP-KDO synthetase)